MDTTGCTTECGVPIDTRPDATAINLYQNQPCDFSCKRDENVNRLMKFGSRKARCDLYERLWGSLTSTHDYNIPVGSFIPRKFPGSKEGFSDEPRWFKCKLSMMPTLIFYFRSNRLMKVQEQCTILTKNGKHDTLNQICIEKVKAIYRFLLCVNLLVYNSNPDIYIYIIGNKLFTDVCRRETIICNPWV